MTIDDALAAIVRGDEIGPGFWRDLETEPFCGAAERHGVLPLVAQRLKREPAGAPASLAARVGDLARAHLAADLEREAELRTALAALAAAGLRPVIFKGAHLAYRDYPRPDLRPREDSDVLIPPAAGARAAADRALVALGYAADPHVGGDLVMTQRMYVKRSGLRTAHALDLHWRVATPQAFARMLDHEELAAGAEPIPALGPAACGPSGPHALLIACAHRMAHHGGSDCLIWLVDIDRIARRLTRDEWNHFTQVADERQVRAICDASLSAAAARFGTPVPDAVRTALGQRGAEASARYLTPPADSVSAALADLRALPSWSDRARLVREHVLPPAAYMRGVYAPGSRAPLAWLYVRRLSAGVRKWRDGRRTARGGRL